MPDWLHLGAPLLFCVLLYLAEARSIRIGLKRAKVQFKRARIRQLVAIEESHHRVVGKVISPDGGSVNLGTSVERADKIRGNPELEGESFIIESKDGQRFRVRPGKLRIQRLPGAERKLVRTVTTDSGVEQTYSFEVPDGFELMIVGRLEGSTDAFRGGPRDLAPLEQGYRLAEELPDVRGTPTQRKVPTDKSATIFGAVLAAAAIGIGYIPWVGPPLWGLGMMLLLCVVAVFSLGGGGDITPLSADDETKLESLKLRVDVPDDVGEYELVEDDDGFVEEEAEA